MRTAIFGALLFVLTTLSGTVFAQQAPSGLSWIQVEAQPTRTQAIARAGRYADEFDNVVGFEIGNGWHGIALGPFDRQSAVAELATLRNSGRIPRDSFIANGTSYRDQYWPLDGMLPVPTTMVQVVTPTDTSPTETVVAIAPPDETLAQARRSERGLTRDEKRLLQTAMEWAGSYNGAIDGLYGRGTRRAMADWQTRNGYDDTGVLTTKQRAALLTAYNAILDGMGLRQIDDEKAGISIQVPTGVLGSREYDAPFVRYESQDGSEAKLILISQNGNETRLRALFDILQTLAIIPEDGPRSVNRNRFTIEGADSKRHTSAFARLQNGQIKGAILVWPTGDDARRNRVKAEIFDSFSRTDGVLEDAAFLDTGAVPVDLLAGLEIRRPISAQSGLFLNNQGLVLTAISNLASCGKIVMAEQENAKIIAHNDHLAILAPHTSLAPAALPVFQATTNTQAPFQITVGGFSYGGLLGSPTLTAGRIEALQDLTGTDNIARLSISTLAGDVGGPVFDRGGAVVGVLLPPQMNGNRQLPQDVQFAALMPLANELLQQAGVSTSMADFQADMDPVDLMAHANDTAALVTCWD
ncbi:MAG: trypsin-like peptidase domain-containing protein [Planktomarina sp.]